MTDALCGQSGPASSRIHLYLVPSFLLHNPPPPAASLPPAATGGESRPLTKQAGTHRNDIQGLRTLAVGLVIWYHIWPGSLPGGFVGVDVFFVISGYLIVGSLVREAVSTGGIQLARFYVRRIRRLLPAAATVLLATLAATLLIFPQSRWQSVSRDIAASGLNIQNWNQAFSTTSYEGATASVSPLQHFWSLAVEEQFYLVIPLLLLACAGAARRSRTLSVRSIAISVLAALTAASFIHSVVFSATNPDLAYFFTTTRIWELGLGGLLAVVRPRLSLRPATSAVVGWLGLLMILAAALSFSTAMEFPGWIALLPVTGTLLMLASGSSAGALPYVSPIWWQSRRPVTYLGDISYSLYLWHWPVTVFSVYLLGPAPDWLHGGGILLGSLALAALSTRFIEKPFRRFEPVRRRGGGRRRASTPSYRTVFALGAVLTTLPIALAAAPYLVVEQKTQALSQELDLASYPGAMAAMDPAATVPELPVRPDPAVAAGDRPSGTEDCLVSYDPDDVDYNDCVFGDPQSSRSIVLVGDSHAAQYMETVDVLARENGYRLYVLARNGCPFNIRPLHSDTFTYTNCSGQNEQTIQDILSLEPDIVITAALSQHGYEEALDWRWENDAEAQEGFTLALTPLRDAGIQVAALSEVPYPPFSVPECLSTEAAGEQSCSFAPAQEPGPLTRAGKMLDGVTMVDFSGYFCTPSDCPPVIGNVLVYRDNHITNTFAKTLALPLAEALGL